MDGGTAKKVSAASARAHTRRANKAKPIPFSLSPAMFVPIAVALTVGLFGWAYQALKPPPPKICGSPGGPLVTSPRVKLSDGRHLAYREMGVPKDEAKYKIIFIHGFDGSKDVNLPLSQTLDKLHKPSITSSSHSVLEQLEIPLVYSLKLNMEQLHCSLLVSLLH